MAVMQFLWVALLGAPIAAAATLPYQLPAQPGAAAELPMSPALISAMQQMQQAGQLRGIQVPPQTMMVGMRAPAQPALPAQLPAQLPMQMSAQMPAQTPAEEVPLQQATQQALPQAAPPAPVVLEGLAAEDPAAVEVKSAAPAAKKGSLPDMPGLMGASFETFGNLVFSLNTDADEVESQIHSLQQEETRRFAQKKAQLEQRLQDQRAATEAIRAQIAQVEAQVGQLQRADEADTQKAEQLQDENQKLADQLRRSQAALGVAARRFQEHVAQDLNEMKDGLGAAEQESTAAALEATYPTPGAGTVTKADEPAELSADQPAQVQPAQVQPAQDQPPAAPVKIEKKKHHLLQKKSGVQGGSEATSKKVVGCNKKGCHILSSRQADELDDDEDEDEDEDQDGGSGYAADDADEDEDDDNDAPSYHYRAGASFLQAARSVHHGRVHHGRQPGPDALEGYRMAPSNPEGVLETLRQLTAKATSLMGIEKQADKSLQEAFDRAFEEGAGRQNTAAEQLRRLTKQRDELQKLLAHRQASVKRLQAVHDHLQQDLAKVDASLQSVEHFGDTVASLASGSR